MANAIKSRDRHVEGHDNCESITYLSKHKSIKDRRVKLIKITLPRIIKKVAETLINRDIPQKQIYVYRNFLEFEFYTNDYKRDMKETLQQYETYKK